MGIGANSGTLTLAEALKVAFLKGSIHLLASSRPSCWPRWRGGGGESSEPTRHKGQFLPWVRDVSRHVV